MSEFIIAASAEPFAERIRGWIGKAALVNVVGEQKDRRRIFNSLQSLSRSEVPNLKLDGRVYEKGGVVQKVEEFLTNTGEKGRWVVIDFWSCDLIKAREVEGFRKLLDQFKSEHRTLILGTTDAINARGAKDRTLFPAQMLADAYILGAEIIGGWRAPDPKSLGAGLAGAMAPIGLVNAGVGSALALTVAGAVIYPFMRGIGSKRGSDKSRGGRKRNIKRGSERTKRTFVDAESSFRARSEEASLEHGAGRAVKAGKRLDEEALRAGIKRGTSKVKNWVEDSSTIVGEALSAGTTKTELKHKERVQDAEAVKWGEFLRYLGGFDGRLEEEARAMGLALDDKGIRHIPIYLKKVGYEPVEFVAGLFRVSDVMALFVGFDPKVQEVEEFLEEQFELWLKKGELELREIEASMMAGGLEEESTLLGGESVRPVRMLYQALAELDGEEFLIANLEATKEYQELVGPPEPRFCEWVYNLMERRELINTLKNRVIRPGDERRLRERLGLDGAGRQMSWPESLRELFGELGVYEPGLPPAIDQGVLALQQSQRQLELWEGEPERLETIEGQGVVVEARKALERLLKLVVYFFWKGGLEGEIEEVISGSLYGFRAPRMKAAGGEEMLQEVQGWSAGQLNMLLKALSELCVEREVEPSFLRAGQKERFLWSRPVFERVGALNDRLNKLAHDNREEPGVSKARVLESLTKAVGAVVDVIEEQALRVPEPIQFFRRYEDGHGVHYEGYTSEARRMWFYEVEAEFELGVPYLFLAATNPSALDAVCIPLPEHFEV